MLRYRQRGKVYAGYVTVLLAIALSGCGSTKNAPPTTTDPTPAPTASLKAASTTITAGKAVVLTWTSANATSVTIDPSISTTALPLSGSQSITPSATTTYTLTATGSGGKTTATATVTVTTNPSTPPTVTLTATPATIAIGGTSALAWTSSNATSVTIAPSIGAATLALSGSANVTPANTTTYTITATGPGGTASATVAVTVNGAPPIVALTADPTTIFTGGTSTLNWTSANADTVTIAPAVGTGPLPVNGSAPVTPATTTTYTITATGSQQTTTSTATVTVLPPGSAQSDIHHLIVLIMQNHSFDNLFGTFPNVNGLATTDPGYSQVDASGRTVMPTLLPNLNNGNLNHDHTTYSASWDDGKMDKFAATNGDLSMQYADNTVFGTTKDGKQYGVNTLWNYAQQFVLADNFFASAMNTEPADMLYMLAATVHDDHTAGSLPYYDKCSVVEQKKDGGGSIAAPLKETNVGDQMTAAKVSWVWYQGNFSHSVDGTCADYVPQENAFQYFTSTANSPNVQNFSMPAFQKILTDSTLPSVIFFTPAPSYGMHPGSGDAANGIEYLDNFVQTVANSPVWPDTAIIVLWDESGGWYDHVAPPQFPNSQSLGMRVPVIAISPFAKQGVVSHQQMDFVSITRFIQWNWGLGLFKAPLQAAREQQSGDICDLLTIPCASP